jgi:hypothetical protein
MNRAQWITAVSVAVCTFIGAKAHAVKVLIVTDQSKAVKAREVANLFRTTEPFSLMRGLEFKVIQTSARKLGCEVRAASALEAHATVEMTDEDALAKVESQDRLATLLEQVHLTDDKAAGLPASCNDKGGTVPTRLISCQSATTKTYIDGLLASEKATYAIIVKDESRYGGSGGVTPVITTGSPASMAIHEFMHRLGFADEYGYYNSCEADIYCEQQRDDVVSRSGYGSLPGTSFNVARFNAYASYKNDSEVRTRHASQLPWLPSVSKSTRLTTGSKLGTPEAGKIGIYRAIVCDKATKKTETWQSTSRPNIMQTLSTTLVPKPYWSTIAKSLGTKLSLTSDSSQDE